MSIKEFDKTFGLRTSIEEEKKRFINRIEHSILYETSRHYVSDRDSRIFRGVCYQLGEDASSLISLYGKIPDLTVLTVKDFIKTLRVIVALYKYYEDSTYNQNNLSQKVTDALEKTALNIGVKWADGIFYPTGDKILDVELIETSLELLEKFPNEKLDLKQALDNHNSNKSYGVIENCYKAIEGIGRQLLNNKKTLDNNKEDLLRFLQFSKYWDKIFLNYLNYAHEYSRHAGENRHDLKPSEVEGFLYLTCLIIRVTLKAKTKDGKDKD